MFQRPFFSPTILSALALAIVVGLAPQAGATTDLAQPNGEVILKIGGDIGSSNQEGEAWFDLDMLKSLPAREITTSSIWYEGTRTFVGVPLDILLDTINADGTTLKAVAVNAYAVTIPIDESLSDGPILAYLMDGMEMPLRDKGPLWVVYPYDSDAKFRNEIIYGRSIWQLERLEVGSE